MFCTRQLFRPSTDTLQYKQTNKKQSALLSRYVTTCTQTKKKAHQLPLGPWRAQTLFHYTGETATPEVMINTVHSFWLLPASTLSWMENLTWPFLPRAPFFRQYPRTLSGVNMSSDIRLSVTQNYLWLHASNIISTRGHNPWLHPDPSIAAAGVTIALYQSRHKTRDCETSFHDASG